ncbi:MAG: glycogen/starch synthase [Lentimicrobiaceae bacterium]|jgi:starch synthase|nr:glycogen/starch synthase [Lentimicrobiaceae bacterium]
MEKTRILFVTQEITPYLPESNMGTICRYLPQAVQENGKEIRTFMPRFGNINERRNQLHEVIRLSGMNLIIDNTDHPLIIKVASIQSARMQIYFIDNEDYFQRKFIFHDKNQKFFKDNDERAIFFVRGVLETVKKLGWSPDIIHCHGWMTSLLPLYVKRAYRDNPLFAETKVIYSVYDDAFEGNMSKDFSQKIKMEGITNKDLKYYKKSNFVSLMQSAIDYSDGLIISCETINAEVSDYLTNSRKPFLPYQPIDNFIEKYSNFYNEILTKETID